MGKEKYHFGDKLGCLNERNKIGHEPTKYIMDLLSKITLFS